MEAEKSKCLKLFENSKFATHTFISPILGETIELFWRFYNLMALKDGVIWRMSAILSNNREIQVKRILNVFWVSSILLYFPLTTSAQTHEILEKWPITIICQRETAYIFGYLAEVKEDGTAVYLSPNGRQSAVVSEDGTLKSRLASKGGCDGQTIQELREKGLTVEAPK
ncbi:MAG: hypothetical protein V7754_15645 [Halioglobus sp.]